MPTIFEWQNLKRRWTTLHLSPTPISSTAVAWSQQRSFHSKYPAVPDSTSTSLPGCDHARCHQQLCTLDERCLGKHVEVVVPETRKPPTKPTVPVKYSRIMSNQNLLWFEFFFFKRSIAICKKHILKRDLLMNSFLASPYGVTPLGLLDFVSFLGSALGAGFFFLLAAADLEGFLWPVFSATFLSFPSLAI